MGKFFERSFKVGHCKVRPSFAHEDELGERALRIAQYISDNVGSGQVGKPVLLVLPPGLEVIETVFACFYAGIIAVIADFPRRRSSVGMLEGMVEAIPGAVGVNNHQGSQATSDPELMNELMPVLRQKNLFYIDSRTSVATVAFDAAKEAGVPTAFRNVPFLDDVQDKTAIQKQLQLALHGAKEKRAAIAIGHPHPATLEALRKFLPTVRANGVQLVFASDLAR